MNLEPNNKSLSFAEFLDAAIRDKAEAKPFPYTLEVCRCRYCSFCQNGKCALKRCCCMNERVKARSCTFAELLRDCFANFKDNVFQFRLRIACERATELHTCFLDPGHRARFYEGVSYKFNDLLSFYADAKEDIFLRADSFKDKTWYGDIALYTRIGVCKPKPIYAKEVCRALRQLGYGVTLKFKGGDLYVTPYGKNKKPKETEAR